ncbi:hypothetical protein TSUD_173560 [Trifolium subterraneum]|nr:hypothetical protein TSUD_173560 [Trifolium subterraneum]
MEEVGLSSEAHECFRDRASCVGDVSEASPARSVPSDACFSDAGDFEIEEDEDEEPRDQHQVDRTSQNCVVDLGEGDKNSLSSLGVNSCQQPFLENNNYAPLVIFEEELAEKDYDSERRRLVSLTCQQKRDVGGTYGFLNSSNKSENILNNLEGQEVQFEHVITTAIKHADFSCVAQVGVTHVAIKDFVVGSATGPQMNGLAPNGPILSCHHSNVLSSGLEGGTTDKELRSRLISKPLFEQGRDAVLQKDKSPSINLMEDKSDSPDGLEMETVIQTPLRLSLSERSRMSSPSSFSSFRSDLSPEMGIPVVQITA